jgi:hypothetical protein
MGNDDRLDVALMWQLLAIFGKRSGMLVRKRQITDLPYVFGDRSISSRQISIEQSDSIQTLFL